MRFGAHLEAHGPYASPERIGRLAVLGFLFPHDSTDGLLESMERFASNVRLLLRA